MGTHIAVIDAALGYMPGYMDDCDTDAISLLATSVADGQSEDQDQDGDDREDKPAMAAYRAADNRLLRPLPVETKVVNGCQVTVYESSADALNRAMAIWLVELVQLREIGSIATSAERKRIRVLQGKLDLEPSEPEFHYSARIKCSADDSDIASYYVQMQDDQLDSMGGFIPVEIQYAVARGQFAEFESNLIDAIDRGK